MEDAASFGAVCAVEGREGGGCGRVKRGGDVARSSQLKVLFGGLSSEFSEKLRSMRLVSKPFKGVMSFAFIFEGTSLLRERAATEARTLRTDVLRKAK